MKELYGNIQVAANLSNLDNIVVSIYLEALSSSVFVAISFII